MPEPSKLPEESQALLGVNGQRQQNAAPAYPAAVAQPMPVAAGFPVAGGPAPMGASPQYGGYQQQYQAPPQLETMPVGPFFQPELDKHFNGVWSDGLCDCFSDCETCLLCSFISPILLYQITDRLPRAIRSTLAFGIAEPLVIVLLYIASIVLTGFIGVTVFICYYIVYTMYLSVAMRYEIPEQPGCGLFCKACYCGSCMVAQMARHIGRAQGFIRLSTPLRSGHP